METENTMHVYDGSYVRYTKDYGAVTVKWIWDGAKWVRITNSKQAHRYAKWIESQPTF